MYKRITAIFGAVIMAFIMVPADSVTASTSRYERSFNYGPAELTAIWHPLSSGRRPVVIMVHGGGWRRGTRESLSGHARFMADRGYQVFNLDYRLKVPWPAPRDDVAAAYDWIAARAGYFAADMSDVVLFGESAGGQLVTNLGTLGQAGYVFRGVVGMSPVADPRMAYEDGMKPDASDHDKVLRDAAFILAGECEPVACPNKWRSMASKTGAGAGDPPMLLIHSAEEWVPSKHSEQLCAALARYGVPCTVKVYPGNGHAMDVWNQSANDVMSFIDSVTLNSTEERAGGRALITDVLLGVAVNISTGDPNTMR
ncbi:hypothetical protein Pth03_04590 [Planotetraspora thailandica]|uniref:Alpha/beta hydrolase fold-3 domain-containing protein n=1 Tax=Planotetraspora thailandica TaxID=487172 RepID=A0A8J3XTE7_9ACTN|nr:alpha/beta hydrolase [Planotetraspora thailandica]GII52070.1 hypothetical protein Pth03_04590 [Planotetraspora thailandica]